MLDENSDFSKIEKIQNFSASSYHYKIEDKDFSPPIKFVIHSKLYY